MRPTVKELEEMAASSIAYRKALSECSFLHFFAYYFTHYINSGFSDFHNDMSNDLMGLARGKYLEVVEVTYRGSSKTSFAKAFVIWCICFEKYKYINWDSYDKLNSERAMFDVVLELQTNRKLIYDFGQLFNEEESSKTKTQKRISNFMTRNGIRVEAHSTQEPVRGRLHGNQRPDFICLDDYETRKTIVSEAVTRSIREHINEAVPGMDPKHHSILWLSNYISETANVQHVIDRLKDNPKAKVRVVPIVRNVRPVWKDNQPTWEPVDGGKSTWPERFVLTDEEAKQTGKVSLEQMRRDMWSPDTGEAEFMLEMMCEPEAYSARHFHRSMFRYVKFDEVKGHDMRVFFAVDPGGSSDDDDLSGKDMVGFTIAWVSDDNIWRVKSWGERLGATAMVTRILDIVEWLIDNGTPMMKFGWEKTQYTAGLKAQFQAEQRRRKTMFPIYELKHSQKKEQRIKGALLHRYETGKIIHIEGECDDLEKQLLTFPDGANDDVIDSAAMVTELAPMMFSKRSTNPKEKPLSKFL
jgi:hypothetical protein